ncbi:hypothetical protein [Geoalkalibacter halelectricus]|uniref:Uncharacterized protein n=1 Tax=Geoalkalibacter halelectricus TaxID=2847045 RepID=A0ABY5ZQB7_9BACT|nr:hypothetical protein [Geoalkalibacter halelectricus]MDO3378549.1 hypothetical protein [Geoalkalibacter halelectricus]UWZ80137.1 hypothetical protein L9S41_01780 [Geoalkalibacter halelectricus]
MSVDESLTPVGDEEWLSRYILQKSHVRHDKTLRPDPFIPHPYADLSVTRHLGLGDKELWGIGEDVAGQIGKSLYGRAENQVKTFERHHLAVVSAPVEGNPNHANVTRWPADKPSQKIIAMEIAAESSYVERT